MRILPVLLISVASVPACARPSPELREPVGLTMVSSASLPGGAADAGAPRDDQACGASELPMIEFAAASAELGERQVSELRRLAECLGAEPYASSSVVLVGYADLVGTVPANLELGLKRASAVMKQLIDGGVSAGRIVVASAGELQRPRARWGLQANRVEILLARGGPSRPDEAPIARGIDARGLMPRPPREVAREPVPASRSVAPPRPPGYGTPQRGGAPQPAPRAR